MTAQLDVRFRRRGLAAVLVATFASVSLFAQNVEGPSPVADALARADKAVQAIIALPDGQRNFDKSFGALDDMLTQLRLDTDFVQFMAYVSPDEQARERGTRAEQDVSNWLIDLGKNEPLYKALKAVADAKPKLEGEQARLLEHTMRDFRRSGMALSPEQREQLTAVQKEITRLGIDFEKNIREDETRVPLTREELTGMPDEFIDGLKKTAGIYLVGMDYPTFLPLMDFCDNETTRKKVWVAYKRRGGRKNVGVLEQMIKARAQAAEMLGYASTAAYETEVRMTKDPETVWKFYRDLGDLVREKAKRDYDEFVAAKRRGISPSTTSCCSRPSTPSIRSKCRSTSRSSRCWMASSTSPRCSTGWSIATPRPTPPPRAATCGTRT
jgi:thimet oligopeptidase